MLALLPAGLILLVCFYGCILWTVVISFTSSRLLPRYDFVGFRNYAALAQDPRAWQAFGNLLVFGVLFVGATLLIGLLLAFAVDRVGSLGRSAFRMIFLWPLSTSWLVTGLIWQWVLNPSLGLQLDLLVREQTALYAVVGAGAWHFAGLIMALFLAGLRTIDPELRQAMRVEGIPVARFYLHVILPMLRPYVVTAVLLLAFAVARTFDLVVAMTGGGPGFATDLPTMLIYDAMFPRGQAGVAAAAAAALMATMVLVLAPYVAAELRRDRA